MARIRLGYFDNKFTVLNCEFLGCLGSLELNYFYFEYHIYINKYRTNFLVLDEF